MQPANAASFEVNIWAELTETPPSEDSNPEAAEAGNRDILAGKTSKTTDSCGALRIGLSSLNSSFNSPVHCLLPMRPGQKV
jgi:hypothetical protein